MNLEIFFYKHDKNVFFRFFRNIYYKFFVKGKHIIPSLRRSGAIIGDGCYISSPYILGSEPYLVEIGNNVYFSGSNIKLFTHDGGTMQLYHMGLTGKKYDNFGKIKIGNNCFIGAESIILKNVTVGDNCIIGAGSVVSKSVPNNSIVAGIPAKVIGTIEQYYQKNKDMYDDTCGWNKYEKYEYIMKNMTKYENRRIKFNVNQ